MKVGTVKRLVGAVVVASALVTIAGSTDLKPLRMEKAPVASPSFLYGVTGP